MSAQTLYEITDSILEIERILETLDEDTEGCRAGIEEYLQSITEGELSEKLEGYVKFMRSLEAQEQMFKAEAEVFAKAATVRRNKRETLKSRLQWFLESTGRESAKAGLFTVALQANGGIAPLLRPENPDYDDLRERGCLEEVPCESAIRDQLMDGEIVPGYSLGERGKHVRIKA